MPMGPETELRTLPGFRAAGATATGGFSVVIPVCGDRLLLAVGSLRRGVPTEEEGCREDIRAVLCDQSLLEGHDPAALLHRSNVELARLGLGRIDALALVSRGDAGMGGSVSGAGHPTPLVVTSDHLTAAAHDGAPLGEGWAVVLGSELAHAGPSSDLLSPDDVRRAIWLLEDNGAPAVIADRTMLAVGISAGR